MRGPSGNPLQPQATFLQHPGPAQIFSCTKFSCCCDNFNPLKELKAWYLSLWHAHIFLKELISLFLIILTHKISPGVLPHLIWVVPGNIVVASADSLSLISILGRIQDWEVRGLRSGLHSSFALAPNDEYLQEAQPGSSDPQKEGLEKKFSLKVPSSTKNLWVLIFYKINVNNAEKWSPKIQNGSSLPLLVTVTPKKGIKEIIEQQAGWEGRRDRITPQQRETHRKEVGGSDAQ